MHTWDYLGVHFSTSSVPTSQSAPYHGQDWDQLVDSRLKDELQKLDRTGCSHWEWIYRVKFHVMCTPALLGLQTCFPRQIWQISVTSWSAAGYCRMLTLNQTMCQVTWATQLTSSFIDFIAACPARRVNPAYVVVQLERKGWQPLCRSQSPAVDVWSGTWAAPLQISVHTPQP